MKKIIILIALFVGISSFASAQNVVIQSNNSTSSQSSVNDKQYYINGISTREDIGGVDVKFKEVDYGSGYSYYELTFTNYHSSPVTVMYELNGADGKTYGYINLKANETKTSAQYRLAFRDQSIIMIVRKI